MFDAADGDLPCSEDGGGASKAVELCVPARSESSRWDRRSEDLVLSNRLDSTPGDRPRDTEL